MIKTVERRTRSAFVAVLLLPALFGAATLWLEHSNTRNLTWVTHSQEVLRTVNRLIARAYEAESNQRGYLLTGDSSFLERYRRFSAAERDEVRRFGEMTSDNPVQQSNATRLTRLWQQRALLMDQVLELRKAGPFNERMAGLLREGRALTDEMNAIAAEMNAEELRLLALRKSGQASSERALAWMFAASLIVNILILYWAYHLVVSYARARDAAEGGLIRLNMDLEKRVQERTAALKEVNDSLLRSNQDLAQFAYVASHDLQEPLRTVASYAGLLGKRYEGQLDEQAEKFIRLIISGAKRMQSMVQDLLLYAQAGTQQISYSRFDFGKVLDVVELNLRALISEANAHIEREALPVIEADEGKIAMVLQNLISNAIKFRSADRPPVVRVVVRSSSGDWVFEVSDNGIGFDPSYAGKIFVIFQRLHQLGEYAGTGIGLAICKRIIEGHGGRIWAQSVPGEGSVFSFAIPMHPPRPAQSHPEAADLELRGKI